MRRVTCHWVTDYMKSFAYMYRCSDAQSLSTLKNTRTRSNESPSYESTTYNPVIHDTRWYTIKMSLPPPYLYSRWSKHPILEVSNLSCRALHLHSTQHRLQFWTDGAAMDDSEQHHSSLWLTLLLLCFVKRFDWPRRKMFFWKIWLTLIYCWIANRQQ